MKIKSNYVLQEIDDEYLVVPIAEEADRLHGVIRLNETGAFLWRCLEKDDFKTISDLKTELIHEYGISEVRAYQDVSSFINQLENLGCIQE